MKPLRKWLIVYLLDGEVYGPVWEHESRVKPVQRAKWDMPAHTHAPLATLTYKIISVERFEESGYTDDFIKLACALA